MKKIIVAIFVLGAVIIYYFLLSSTSATNQYIKKADDKSSSLTKTVDTKPGVVTEEIFPITSLREGSYIKTPTGMYVIEYGERVKFEGVDPDTFRVVGLCLVVEMSASAFVADKNHIFVNKTPVDYIDPATLSLVGKVSSKQGEEIPYTFYVWKDKNHVYANCGKVIKEADINSIAVVDGKVQDKNNFYQLNTAGGYVVFSR